MLVARTLDQHVDVGARIKAFDDVIEVAKQLPELAMPWLWKPERQKVAAQSMADQWASIWGDPNDLETKKRIDSTVAMLMEPIERRKKEMERAPSGRVQCKRLLAV